jgi:hypothetical protein
VRLVCRLRFKEAKHTACQRERIRAHRKAGPKLESCESGGVHLHSTSYNCPLYSTPTWEEQLRGADVLVLGCARLSPKLFVEASGAEHNDGGREGRTSTGAFLVHPFASLSETLLRLNIITPLSPFDLLWSVRYRAAVHEPQAMTTSRCGVHRDQQPPDAHYDVRLMSTAKCSTE